MWNSGGSYGFEGSSYVNAGAALSFSEFLSQFPAPMAAAVSVLYHITPTRLRFSKTAVYHNNVECPPRIKSVKQIHHTVFSFIQSSISLMVLPAFLPFYSTCKLFFSKVLNFYLRGVNIIQDTLELLKLEPTHSLSISNIIRKFLCFSSTELSLYCTQEILCF